MTNSIIKTDVLRSISSLQDEHFLVVDYQRGYKWTSIEVPQLLKDIEDFNRKGFYCLQPVVIKHITEESINKIELIHGNK